jgi:hypothetical protein
MWVFSGYYAIHVYCQCIDGYSVLIRTIGGTMSKRLFEFVPDFMVELEEQLQEDEKRYGDDWKSRSREGQVERIYRKFYTYQYEFATKGVDVPWLKIAGLAMIGWIRDKYAKEE